MAKFSTLCGRWLGQICRTLTSRSATLECTERERARERKNKTDLPFHTKHVCNGGATALICMVADANAVNSYSHALTDTLEHGRGTWQNDIRAQALADVEFTFHNPQGRCVMDSAHQETHKLCRCSAVLPISVRDPHHSGLYWKRTNWISESTLWWSTDHDIYGKWANTVKSFVMRPQDALYL